MSKIRIIIRVVLIVRRVLGIPILMVIKMIRLISAVTVMRKMRNIRVRSAIRIIMAIEIARVIGRMIRITGIIRIIQLIGDVSGGGGGGDPMGVARAARVPLHTVQNRAAPADPLTLSSIIHHKAAPYIYTYTDTHIMLYLRRVFSDAV